MFDTSVWAWPQWTILVLLFLGFLITASQHGRPRVQLSGPDKGKPEEYNGFTSIARFALWMFVLVAGGFFS